MWPIWAKTLPCYFWICFENFSALLLLLWGGFKWYAPKCLSFVQDRGDLTTISCHTWWIWSFRGHQRVNKNVTKARKHKAVLEQCWGLWESGKRYLANGAYCLLDYFQITSLFLLVLMSPEEVVVLSLFNFSTITPGSLKLLCLFPLPRSGTGVAGNEGEEGVWFCEAKDIWLKIQSCLYQYELSWGET